MRTKQDLTTSCCTVLEFKPSGFMFQLTKKKRIPTIVTTLLHVIHQPAAIETQLMKFEHSCLLVAKKLIMTCWIQPQLPSKGDLRKKTLHKLMMLHKLDTIQQKHKTKQPEFCFQALDIFLKDPIGEISGWVPSSAQWLWPLSEVPTNPTGFLFILNSAECKRSTWNTQIFRRNTETPRWTRTEHCHRKFSLSI